MLHPDSLRAIGWPGEIFPIGGWGGGVFNGGAWLRAGRRHLDVHYRDLDDVEHHLAEARAGRFAIERLLFHLAGVPTYIVVAGLGRQAGLTAEPGRLLAAVAAAGTLLQAATGEPAGS